MNKNKYYTTRIVAKQRRRADLSIEQRRIKRNILRKNTGKHLLMNELLGACKLSRALDYAVKSLTTPIDVITS